MTTEQTLPSQPPTTTTLTKKGLNAGSVGLLGATVIGISCIAPEYTLTSALGPTVDAVGVHVPAIFVVGFLPMLFVALGYRELNKVMPDSGTSFTWVSRAMGPWAGWLAGFGLAAATIIVLSNLASVGVDFFYLALSEVFSTPSIADWTNNAFINVATCLAFMAAATWVAYRDIRTTQRVQYWLVGFQALVMVFFGSMALYRVFNGEAFDRTPFSMSWFNPFEIGSFSAFAAGLSLSVFVFWGWDVVLTMNEETKGSNRTPGIAAGLSIAAILAMFTFVSIALIMYSGTGDTGLGLTNPDIQDNVFLGVAEPILGGLAIIVALACLSSSAASLQSTFVSPARTLLAMGHYGALPKKFAQVHPRFRTPSHATIVSSVIASVFYAVLRFASENVLWDTVATLGALICFYYGLTAFACVWYFRKQWFLTARTCFLRLVLPLVGGLTLAVLFVTTVRDSIAPDYGSGSSVGGVGLVFVLTVVVLAIGVTIMLVQSRRNPDFFRGLTIPRGIAGDANEAQAALAE